MYERHFHFRSRSHESSLFATPRSRDPAVASMLLVGIASVSQRFKLEGPTSWGNK